MIPDETKQYETVWLGLGISLIQETLEKGFVIVLSQIVTKMVTLIIQTSFQLLYSWKKNTEPWGAFYLDKNSGNLGLRWMVCPCFFGLPYWMISGENGISIKEDLEFIQIFHLGE